MIQIEIVQQTDTYTLNSSELYHYEELVDCQIIEP